CPPRRADVMAARPEDAEAEIVPSRILPGAATGLRPPWHTSMRRRTGAPDQPGQVHGLAGTAAGRANPIWMDEEALNEIVDIGCSARTGHRRAVAGRGGELRGRAGFQL